MSEPFIAEIRIFAGTFAPLGWAFCNGQLLPIAQNTALFSLIGTTYGGDGRSTTALPNMAGRAAMHPGRGPGLTARRLGERGGTETVSLSTSQMPSHSHSLLVSSIRADETAPSQNVTLGRASSLAYAGGQANSTMSDQTVSTAGGDQPHNNMQPLLAMNFIIALRGLYPSRS